MASKIERKFNTFVKGLITEAGPISFPDNASLDEDNCILNLDGSRQRRLGIDYELNHILTTSGFSTTVLRQANIQFFRWDGPGGDTDISVGIIRIYNKLWFINLLEQTPSGAFMNEGLAFTLRGLGNKNIETTPINNLLVIVGAELDLTVLLTYDRETTSIYVEEIPLLVRDVWGVDDGLGPSDRPVDLSTNHHYNLINQGWNANIQVTGSVTSIVPNPSPPPFSTPGTGFSGAIANSGLIDYISTWTPSIHQTVPNTGTAIEATKSSIGFYPSNADIWTLGKESDPSEADYQKYNGDLMARNSVDNVYAPKASIIVDAYNRGQSRRNSTGLQTLLLDKELNRCTTVASYASRVFYAGVQSATIDADIRGPNYSGYIFFSQIVLNKEKISLCYQDADPTSPDINDIIDTDGGTIQIPAATKIVKLVSSLGSLLVLAENGIWEIYGDSGGFTATSFQLSKVSDTGITNGKSAIEVDGSVFVWSNNGIYLLTSDEVTGRFKAENISLAAIQKYYNAISTEARDNCTVTYDRQNSRIRWLYNDDSSYGSATGLYKYNKELILDLTLKAFYPSTIYYSDLSGAPHIHAYVDMPEYVVSYISDDVLVASDVVTVSGEDVTIQIPDYTSQGTSFKFLTTQGTSFTLSSYRNTTFHDWYTYNGVGFDYTSYLISGYDIAGDFLREKHMPYIETFFIKTEDGFTDVDGVLYPNNESSCLLQAQWQWHNTPTGNKWSTAKQAYRMPRVYTPSGDADTYDTGASVVVTKSKLRGSGKSLSLQFTSEEGKDMRLLGWGYQFTSPQAL